MTTEKADYKQLHVSLEQEELLADTIELLLCLFFKNIILNQ